MNIYSQLSGKWVNKHTQKAKSIAGKHGNAINWLKSNLPGKEHLASGVLGGLLLLTAHASPSARAQSPTAIQLAQELHSGVFAVSDLAPLIPSDVRELTPVEEEKIEQVLARDYHISVKPEINGMRLNRSYGYIGQEQHLARFPGDSLLTHFTSKSEEEIYGKYGMAPGLGAYGYFAESKEAFTKKEEAYEKYYIAVQTFLAPNFPEKVKEYRDFFKFRKMLVVNPQNGKAVVVVIGDAGPASWTGKHLGGSPEVMQYLERVDGRQKGPVLYFFIDDPEDTIALGPVTQ